MKMLHKNSKIKFDTDYYRRILLFNLWPVAKYTHIYLNCIMYIVTGFCKYFSNGNIHCRKYFHSYVRY